MGFLIFFMVGFPSVFICRPRGCGSFFIIIWTGWLRVVGESVRSRLINFFKSRLRAVVGREELCWEIF